jgi:hypothetical protein
MDNNLPQKTPKIFLCENCDFNTCNKKDYMRHISTGKHKRITNDNKRINEKTPDYFQCECGKVYKYLSGLSRHRTKHNCINNQCEDEIDTINLHDSQCILQILKQNEEFKNLILEQNKIITEQNTKLFDLCKTNNGFPNYVTNNIHTNSHNKTFNLQVFLNETCKNAMNIMDFVNSIQIQLADLENVGEVGYVQGISNIIIKNLKALDVTNRPIHCSDSKREILYVKDNDKWEKEDDDKKRLTKAIKYIANKNYKLIKEFKAKYPDCIYSHSNKSDQYNKLIIEALGGDGGNDEDNHNKIIKKIAKTVTIDKSNF